MRHLLMLSGSQRRESYNGRLLRDLEQRLNGCYSIDQFGSAEIDLPIFDQDLECSPAILERVAALHRRCCKADGMIVASPEYNGLPSPYLKNLVDWLSRLAYLHPDTAHPFEDCPLLLCCASTGWSGGAIGTPHARVLFGHVGALVMGDAIHLPYADQAWCEDAGCYLFDQQFTYRIDSVLRRFIHIVDALAFSPSATYQVEN